MNLSKIDLNAKLPWWLLIAPVLLVLIYSMLSYVAFLQPVVFHESMNIPVPEHGFMLLSWGGKNTAIVVGLIIATAYRRLFPLLMMMVVLLTMQLGDMNAGAQTNVNVFISYIAMGLVFVQAILIAIWQSRTQTQLVSQPA